MKKQLSIKEIAELAGTSVATVSRVINQNGRFSKETEQKILQIMEEYNYRPNVLAKGLRQNKLKLVGVILPDITLSFFASIYRYIELELYEHGYLPVLCDTNEDDVLEQKYVENLKNLRFSGLICLNGIRHHLARTGLRTIYVDRYPNSDDNADIYFLGSNNYQGGYLAAQTLIKAGRKRLSIVLFGKQLETLKQRYLGFVQALNDYGYPLYPDMVYTVTNVSFQDGYDITQKILESDPPCDGIFYSSDILALGGLRLMKERGISIPDDLSIIGFDDIPMSQMYGLTTIRQNVEDIGRLAARSIVSLIEDEEVLMEQILDVELVERDTV